MNLKATIEGYKAACIEAAEEESMARLAVETARANLRRAETVLIGAKERSIQAREALRQFEDRRVYDEVTSREVEIALMKGVTLHQGEELTQELKDMLRYAPALERFQP